MITHAATTSESRKSTVRIVLARIAGSPGREGLKEQGQDAGGSDRDPIGHAEPSWHLAILCRRRHPRRAQSKPEARTEPIGGNDTECDKRAAYGNHDQKVQKGAQRDE